MILNSLHKFFCVLQFFGRGPKRTLIFVRCFRDGALNRSFYRQTTYYITVLNENATLLDTYNY